MGKKTRILVVDDHEAVRDLLAFTLKRAGYAVRRARHAASALRKAMERPPDVIFLDVMMPGRDGFSLCGELRERLGTAVRIVFLTARMDEQSEVAGFDAGADDYITKPIKTEALLRRLRALLRRPAEEVRQQQIPAVLQIADLELKASSCELRQAGRLVSLRKREFDLIYVLAAAPGEFFSRERLMERVWGETVYVAPRTIDVHIRRIREKVGEDYIVTRKKVGYAFKHAEASA